MIAGGAIASVLLMAGFIKWMSPGAEAYTGPTFEARRGPLLISVTESGTIQSRDRVAVKSEVEGRTTILWLIPEGTMVEKGDLLVELDSSDLEDNRLEQQIRVQNAEAAFIRARETLEINRNQAEADIAQAKLDYRFAQLNLTKYLEGEYPQELQRAEADITLANEELQRATDKLVWSERLADEGYITRMEMQADELSAKRSRIDLELARSKLNLLKEYTHLQKKEELESSVEQKRMALDRVERRAAADVMQAEADLNARRSELERQQSRLDKIEQQIEKCTIRSPAAGMVVHVKTGRPRNPEPLEEGQEVRERQDLIHLPTAASMMAEISIHESTLNKVSTGLPARVSVDAIPDRVYKGSVARIAVLPDPDQGFLNPDLTVFRTDVHLEGRAEELRPGMSCRAEIIIDSYDDVVYVPVQSVVREGGHPTVYINTPEGPRPRVIELGLDNNRMAHVISGVEPGEHVLLNPPLDTD